MATKISYQDSGVDVDAGNRLVDDIKNDVDSTHIPGVIGGIGGFGGLFDLSQYNYNKPVLVSATDGVGTKLEISVLADDYRFIGIDLVAMCVNDIIVQGAKPLFFLDYFATGKLDSKQAKEIIHSVTIGCKQAGCALVGGETAEMPGVYPSGLYDIAGFSVGIVEKDSLLPKADDIKEGDVIFAIKSSGLHANGFSFVRKLLAEHELSVNDYFPFDDKTQIKDILLTPTKIYVEEVMKLIKSFNVKALAHITGGGITENIPRVIPKEYQAMINLKSWDIPDVFKWCMEKANIDLLEMLSVLNCGVGMVFIVCRDEAVKVHDYLKKESKHDVFDIGSIIKKDGGSDEKVRYI